jgi:hypothetical protein
MRCRQIPCYPQERKLLRDFNALHVNSLFQKEQGIFRGEQGIFSTDQGIFLREQGIQGIPLRKTKPDGAATPFIETI